MKAYMFNVESGLYEGETFENDDLIKIEEGLTTAVPPSYDKGQVPVFDLNIHRWSLVPVSVMKTRLNSSHSQSR